MNNFWFYIKTFLQVKIELLLIRIRIIYFIKFNLLPGIGVFNRLATSAVTDASASEAFCSFLNATFLHLGSSNVARPK